MCKGFTGKIFMSFIIFVFAWSLNVWANEDNNRTGVGLDITEKDDIVAIWTSVWFNAVVAPGMRVNNTSEILIDNPEEPNFGPRWSWHYWAEPALGYYRSDDTEVIRQHMKWLADAGIDFIIPDLTNVGSTTPAGFRDLIMWEPLEALLETMWEMRQEGLDTPYIVFWVGANPGDPDPAYTGRVLYEEFYQAQGEKYEDLFVYWDEKPFLLYTHIKHPELKEYFTVRRMWGQMPSAEKEWSFLQYPQDVSMYKGEPEQMSVSVAVQRTFINSSSAITRRGGRVFAEQWERAFEVRPKVIVITSWNEWTAQLHTGRDVEFLSPRYREQPLFVDSYTVEASRDVEPMKDLSPNTPLEFPGGEFDHEIVLQAMQERGIQLVQMPDILDVDPEEVLKIRMGEEPSPETMEKLEKWLAAGKGHGDLYYQWMKEYIRAYKQHESFPEGLTQW